MSDTAVVHTYAVTSNTLLVDNDNNGPDVAAFYQDALTGAGKTFGSWDLGADPVLPATYVNAHENVVWYHRGVLPCTDIAIRACAGHYLGGGRPGSAW